MKNRIPAAVAVVAQLATLGAVVGSWRHLTRQAQQNLARIAMLELDVQECQVRLDTFTATQAWRKASQDITGRGPSRHLASVTALPCPKGVAIRDTLGGGQ